MFRFVPVALSALVAVATPDVANKLMSPVQRASLPSSFHQQSALPVSNKQPSGFGGSARESVAAKGGKIDALRTRIASTTSSEKITGAMRLVAAAKVRRAQEAVTKTVPFTEALEKVIGSLMERLQREDLDLPMLEQRPLKKVTVVSVTGDRGLCGAYNSAIIKMTEKRIAELKELGIPTELITIGKKGTSWFQRRSELYNIAETFDCPQAPKAEFSKEIADKLFAKYLAGETDKIEIIYSKFINLINNEPTLRTMLPLNPSELMKKEKDKEDGMMADMILDQEPETLVNAVVPLYLNNQVLVTLQNAVASELASRMTAMQSASDNAKALKKTLSLEMNRARQAEVTQSIMEIVAGADAR